MAMKVKVIASAAALSLVCVAGLAGCQPKVVEADGEGVSSYEGGYDAYDPDADAAAMSGTAIEGSEEEQLQQDRIAGGAVGKVVSKNLEKLSGIVDGDDANSVDFGMYSQPPARHGFDDNCMNCHDPEKSDAPEGTKVRPMPTSHQGIGLTNDDCRSCHEAAE